MDLSQQAKRARQQGRQAGFTLVELLVVLAILGLLAAIVTPQVMKYLGHAKTSAARLQIQALGTEINLLRLDTGRYPTDDEGLDALISAPANMTGWNGPYVKKKESLSDPWGNPYHYKTPGEHGDYDLYSLGADNKIGGTGENQDLTNW